MPGTPSRPPRSTTLAVRNRNLNEFLARNGRNGQIAALILFCIEHHVVAIGVVLQITVLEGIATRREGLLGCTAGPGNVVRRGREIKLDGLGSCSGSLGLRQLYRSERLAADLGNQLGREGGIGGVVTGNRYRYRRSVLRGDAELVGIGTLDGHIDAARDVLSGEAHLLGLGARCGEGERRLVELHARRGGVGDELRGGNRKANAAAGRVDEPAVGIHHLIEVAVDVEAFGRSVNRTRMRRVEREVHVVVVAILVELTRQLHEDNLVGVDNRLDVRSVDLGGRRLRNGRRTGLGHRSRSVELQRLVEGRNLTVERNNRAHLGNLLVVAAEYEDCTRSILDNERTLRNGHHRCILHLVGTLAAGKNLGDGSRRALNREAGVRQTGNILGIAREELYRYGTGVITLIAVGHADNRTAEVRDSGGAEALLTGLVGANDKRLTLVGYEVGIVLLSIGSPFGILRSGLHVGQRHQLRLVLGDVGGRSELDRRNLDTLLKHGYRSAVRKAELERTVVLLHLRAGKRNLQQLARLPGRHVVVVNHQTRVLGIVDILDDRQVLVAHVGRLARVARDNTDDVAQSQNLGRSVHLGHRGVHRCNQRTNLGHVGLTGGRARAVLHHGHRGVLGDGIAHQLARSREVEDSRARLACGSQLKGKLRRTAVAAVHAGSTPGIRALGLRDQGPLSGRNNFDGFGRTGGKVMSNRHGLFSVDRN